MTPRTLSLDTVQITSPCPLPPDQVPTTGHCDVCNKPVHNLSSMTRDRAAALLTSAAPGTSLCVRFARTPAGLPQTLDYQPPVKPRFPTTRWLPLTIFTSVAGLLTHLLLGSPKPTPAPIAAGGLSLPLTPITAGKIATTSPTTCPALEVGDVMTPSP